MYFFSLQMLVCRSTYLHILRRYNPIFFFTPIYNMVYLVYIKGLNLWPIIILTLYAIILVVLLYIFPGIYIGHAGYCPDFFISLFWCLLQATVLWLIGSRFCASTKEHACPIVQGNLTICKMRWNVPYPTALREGAFDVLEPLDRYIYVMFPIYHRWSNCFPSPWPPS